MKNLPLFLLFGTVMAMTACNTTSDTTTVTTFVIVRHAEKGKDDARDPSLSDAGNARARVLASLLADTPLAAAYATAYRRTQQTAKPSADAHDVPVTTYDAQLSATAFASNLRATHHGGIILVVGHSNTVPEIAGALSGKTTQPMPEAEFSRLYRVTITPDGNSSLVVSSY